MALMSLSPLYVCVYIYECVDICDIFFLFLPHWTQLKFKYAIVGVCHTSQLNKATRHLILLV